MKSNLIYVCKDNNEFLKQLEYLNDEYNKIAYFYKCIHNIDDVRSQLKYINQYNLLCASTFYTKRMIKLTISSDNKRYCVTYRFKYKWNYDIFRKALKEIELNQQQCICNIKE